MCDNYRRWLTARWLAGGALALGMILGSAGTLTAAPAAPGATGVAPVSPADKAAVDQANKFVERGNQFRKNDSLPRAKTEYQKALKVFPRHLDALYNLAVVCERLGQNAEAIAEYKRYLELAPHDADVWTQLGVLYDQANDKKGAMAAYQNALAGDPDFGRAHHNLGVLLEEQGDWDEAEKHLATFVKLEEQAGRQTGDAYYSLGALYLARGREREAKMLLQKAIDTDPTVVYYNNAMGDIYLVESRPELSLVYYRKALEKEPRYAPAYSGMGDAYRQLNDRAKAAEAYHKALELRHDYPVVQYKLGLLLEDTDPVQARKYFEMYLQSGKNLQFTREATARLQKLKGPAPVPATTQP